MQTPITRSRATPTPAHASPRPLSESSSAQREEPSHKTTLVLLLPESGDERFTKLHNEQAFFVSEQRLHASMGHDEP